MSITINGQSRVPPGFRFHPTEEELLNYLRKKVASEKIDLDVIRDVDLNKLEPWDIQEKCRIGSTPPPNDWYFFSHKDKKYPTGTRTNRATVAGFWKATGRDKVIYTTSKRIGMRKTLVFYKGRAPHGQKSDWIMHEYRLDEQYSADSNSLSNDHSCSSDASALEDGWVVCRVFKKKNFHKATMDHSPNSCDGKTQQLLRNPSSSDGALDQILAYMGRSCKQEAEALVKTNNQQHHLRPIETVSGACSFSRRFTKLPAQLESPTHELPSLTDVDFPMISYFDKLSYDQPDGIHAVVNASRAYQPAAEPNLNDWAALDRLVASHLNGDQSDAASKHQLACLDVDVHDFMLPDSHGGGGSGDGDLWSLASSASDHIGSI